MKKLFLTVTMVLLAVCLQAGDPVGKTLSGTQYGTNLSYVCFPVFDNGQAEVTYLNLTSDAATGAVYVATAATPIAVRTAQSAATNIVTLTGTSFATNSWVVFRDISTGTYVVDQLTAATSTNITLTSNLSAAAAVGDLVYKLTWGSGLVVGNANVALSSVGGGVVFGEPSKPTVLFLTGLGTNTVKINIATARKAAN